MGWSLLSAFVGGVAGGVAYQWAKAKWEVDWSTPVTLSQFVTLKWIRSR